MPYSINIRSDDRSSQRIRDLWTLCARLEDQPSMVSLGYPPHFTLASFDEAHESQLSRAVDALSSSLSKVRVPFDRINHFEKPGSIMLWASPADSSALTQIHRQLHRHIDSSSCRTNYQPGTWIPHCTLAIDVDPSRRSEALAITRMEIAPFDVVFDVIDCARLHPVDVIHERALPTAALYDEE